MMDIAAALGGSDYGGAGDKFSGDGIMALLVTSAALLLASAL
jgi:hypothetical protein